MKKKFLKGVALGGLLAGIAVWAHTTPKGRQSKALAEEKLKTIWGKLEKEYHGIDPDKISDIKKDVRAALKTWKSSKEISGDVKRALGWVAKKIS